ncbi:MAG: glycosyltransferase family 39 protein [Candidatus Nanopelagicales bacterium]|nr:glycosyltransferase family 39 protein [Candidatus Nanopelagicales bacterium]
MTARSKVLLTLLGIVVLALYSSWGRPLWLDEYLHFIFGGFASWGDAWAAVQSSTTNINHGQTGFYIMLDYGLLQAFGANLFALRLPSLISGALLLFSVALFLRRKNLGAVAIAAAFLLLAAQPNLMYFIGEARPYMPMAASAMAALAYFSSSAEQRATTPMRLFIWATMVWGALMMPYYLVYLPVIALTCFVIARLPWSFTEFRKFVNLPLQITSVTLGVTIGALTWLRGSPNFQRDPWLILRPLFDSLTLPHYIAAIALLILFMVTVRLGRTNVREPILLFLAMGGMAVLFAVLSLVQSYWILPRQFIASQAIMTVAVVWGIGQALKATPRKEQKILASIYTILILFAFTRVAVDQVQKLSDWENNGFPVAGNPGDEDFQQIDVGPANQNVIDGGPVLPELAAFYDQPRYGGGEDPNQP